MRTLTLLIACLLSFICSNAQPDLETYLKVNRYPIKLSPDGKASFTGNDLPDMLNRQMKSKLLFVYGEGFSHNLYLNGYIENLFVSHFSQQGLKYVFGEQARSWVVVDELFYKDPSTTAAAFYTDFKQASHLLADDYKRIYQQGHFEARAVDFERGWTFRTALDSISGRLTATNRQLFHTLAPYAKDTSYLHLSPAKFVKFYEEQRNKFFKDSAQFKTALGNMYPSFRYLISDPQPSRYTDNRDRNMANHVLWDIGQPQPGTVYFQSCGLHHTRRKGDLIRKSMVGYLEESEVLKGKILTASIYCENCHPVANQYGVGDNTTLKYIKGDVLKAFQQAVGNDQVVLFDLTNLPEKYAYMRDEYVDLLIFAKNAE